MPTVALSEENVVMSLALEFMIIAVGAVSLYALGQRAGKGPPEAHRSLAWLVAAAVAIWVALTALAMGSFLVDEWLYSEDSQRLIPPDPETLAEPCADAAADTIMRIEASLVGDPSPSIAEAHTAAFNIGGQESRVIVTVLIGPGVSDDAAVFMIGPAGAIYAANRVAQELSTLEAVSLDLDVWDEPLGYASRC